MRIQIKIKTGFFFLFYFTPPYYYGIPRTAYLLTRKKELVLLTSH